VIAHRGDWSEFPENSLESFERAIQVGADMIELDLRRTADGHLIAYHDAAVKGIPIARLRHGALRAKGGASRPPLLAEVVAQLAGRIALNLEFKERGCVAEAAMLLRRAKVEQCLITSFLDDVLREAKAQAPQFPTGLVVDGSTTISPVTRARRLGADCVVVELRRADVATLGAAAAADLPCLVWTVNDSATIDRCLRDPAVVGVITDRPALAIERRARLSEQTGP